MSIYTALPFFINLNQLKRLHKRGGEKMAELVLDRIYKVYDNKVTAVDNFDLDIEDKEFLVIVGPSGCGKSTTLRMIAGLEEITDGDHSRRRPVNDVTLKTATLRWCSKTMRCIRTCRL